MEANGSEGDQTTDNLMLFVGGAGDCRVDS